MSIVREVPTTVSYGPVVGATTLPPTVSYGTTTLGSTTVGYNPAPAYSLPAGSTTVSTFPAPQTTFTELNPRPSISYGTPTLATTQSVPMVMGHGTGLAGLPPWSFYAESKEQSAAPKYGFGSPAERSHVDTSAQDRDHHRGNGHMAPPLPAMENEHDPYLESQLQQLLDGQQKINTELAEMRTQLSQNYHQCQSVVDNLRQDMAHGAVSGAPSMPMHQHHPADVPAAHPSEHDQTQKRDVVAAKKPLKKKEEGGILYRLEHTCGCE